MTPSDRDKLLTFMREERYAVQASVSAIGTPQAALVGVIVTDEFEVFFDAHDSSRKTVNLRKNATAALVLGPVESEAERTVQLEGTADEPKGAARQPWRPLRTCRNKLIVPRLNQARLL